MEGWRVWVTRRQRRRFWLSFFLQQHPWSPIYPNPAKKPQNSPDWRRVWVTRHHVRFASGAQLVFSSSVEADLHAGGLFVGFRRRVWVLSSFGFSGTGIAAAVVVAWERSSAHHFSGHGVGKSRGLLSGSRGEESQGGELGEANQGERRGLGKQTEEREGARS